MTKPELEAFCSTLQRAMKRHKVGSIDAQGDRVVIYDEYGRRCASFESLDAKTPNDADMPMSHFLTDSASSER